MPYVLKPNKIFARDPEHSDQFLPQNVITDQTTEDMIAVINAAGTSLAESINSTGTQQIAEMNESGNNWLSAMREAGEVQVTTVNEAGDAQITAINTVGEAKLTALEEARTQAVSDVEQVVTDAQVAVDGIYAHRDELAGIAETCETAAGNTAQIVDDAMAAVEDAQTALDGIDAQRDAMIAAIASVAGQGTDVSLTQSGVAADAAAVGAFRTDLMDTAENLVIVADTQPTEEENKLWILDDGVDEYTIPTYEEFGELKSAISEISSSGLNLFDKDTVEVKNNYLINDLGNESSSSTSGYTLTYIECNPNTKYRFTGFATATGGNARVYYYNSSKVFLSRSDGQSQYDGFVITTPANCYYMRIQFVMATVNWSLLMVSEGETEYPYTPYRLTAYDQVARSQITEISQDVTVLQETVNDINGTLELITGESLNLFDKDSVSVQNNKILDDNGDESSSSVSGYTLSYVECEPNTAYRFTGFANSTGGNARVYYYNSSKVFLSRSDGQNQYDGFVITTPANCYYMRIQFVMATVNWNLLMITKGEDVYPYMAYGAVANDAVVRAEVLKLKDEVDELKDDIVVVLPENAYVVVGSELNIYTQNVVLCKNLNDYAFVWQVNSVSFCDQMDYGFRCRPTANDTGDYNIIFKIRNKVTWDEVYSKDISLHVLPNTSLTGKKVLFIGDSLTNAGYYPYEIQHNLSNSGVISIGTVESQPWFNSVQVSVNHEGRGGWSAHDYVTVASKGSGADIVTNAFWNPSTSKFDFAYYIAQQEYTGINLVFLNLGTNGVSDPDSEVAAINEMITSIRATSGFSTTPILVSLITPPATQDGWTSATHGGSVDNFMRLYLALNQEYIDNYDGQQANIYVSPVYFNLDREHDYPTVETTVSMRNPLVVTIQDNNVHPSFYGYLKFADVYWSMIQYLLG